MSVQREAAGSGGSGSNGSAPRIWDTGNYSPSREATGSNGEQRKATDREATDPHHGFGTRTITLRPGKQRGATGSNGSGRNGPAARIWDPVDHLPAREAKRSKGKQRIRTTNLGLGVPLAGSGSNGNQREATDREATYPHHGFVTQWTNYHPRVL